MEYPTVQSKLDNEARMMGRPCKFLNGWEYHTGDHAFFVLVYDVEPSGVYATIRETRWAVYVDDVVTGGGII